MKNKFTFIKQKQKTDQHLTIWTLFLLMSFSCFGCYGQIQTLNTPSFNSPNQVNLNTPFYKESNVNRTNALSKQEHIQQQNNQAMLRMGYKLPPNKIEIKSGITQQINSVQISKQELQRRQIYQLIKQNSQNKNLSANEVEKSYNGSYRFVDYNSDAFKKGANYYLNAFNEISKMMDGLAPLDLKKAVFLTENAVLKNEISYDDFTSRIDKLKDLLNQIAQKEKLDLNNSVAAHYAIQKLYSDTLIDKKTGTKFYPFKYDFEDIYGEKNYAQTFVSKLLYTGNGQCKSMPLLYSILANELNAESFLAFSPSHSYIKFKDKNGTWYNFETTNGVGTSDSWIIGSGFVKSEAIKSKVYTEPINSKQILAHLLVELTMSYQQEFGFDNKFIEQTLQKALQTFPNDIFAWMVKANMKRAEFDKSIWEANYPPLEQLQNYPEQFRIFNEMMELTSKIDEMGNSIMPEDAYQNWLKSLEDEKQKQENKKIKLEIKLNTLD
jgi:hypothetical protein